MGVPAARGPQSYRLDSRRRTRGARSEFARRTACTPKALARARLRQRSRMTCSCLQYPADLCRRRPPSPNNEALSCGLDDEGGRPDRRHRSHQLPAERELEPTGLTGRISTGWWLDMVPPALRGGRMRARRAARARLLMTSPRIVTDPRS